MKSIQIYLEYQLKANKITYSSLLCFFFICEAGLLCCCALLKCVGVNCVRERASRLYACASNMIRFVEYVLKSFNGKAKAGNHFCCIGKHETMSFVYKWMCVCVRLYWTTLNLTRTKKYETNDFKWWFKQFYWCYFW